MLLNFDYTYAMVNLGSDVITVEVSNDGVAYSTAIVYNTLSGTNGSPTAESLNLTTLLPGLDYETSLLYVRFRVSSGYTLAAQFFVDNVDLVSGTTDCNIGVIDHYQIIHDGTGISCLGSTITIIGHNATHFPSAPGDGEVMALATFQNKGTWASVIAGSGSLADVTVQAAVAANTDGAGTYTWFGNEDTIQLRFNYTDLSTNPELVNFDLGGTFSEDGATPNHDNDLSISEAGLLFYNETAQAPGIPTQIAGKPSNQYGSEDVIILQAIRTSDDDPSVCEPLFPDTQVVNIDFGAECDDPASCSGGDSFSVNGVGITLNDFNGVPGADTYQSVPVTFTNQTTSTGAVLVLNYSDAGQIELHARYDIPFDNNPENAITSEDFIVGSNSFVVRPFGFDIGFTTDPNAANYRADDANGSAFKTAGTTFATTVTAKAWDPAQPEDDMNQDGIPDDDADLSDNPTTANFGAQGTPEEDDVIITHVLVAPAGGVAGSLTGGNLFTSYNFGVSNEDMSYDEVGIITLTAKLADNNFMGSGEDVQGNVVNVGRFYPHNFNLSMAAAGAVCTPKSDFTYMGQRFTVSFMLEARNEANVRTQNYASTFVKLSDSDFDNDAFFHAVDDIDGLADVDYSSRISSLDGSFFAMFDDVGVGTPGIGSVMGTLVFARENDGLLVEGAEDGPYTVRIGTNFVDSDAVPIALTAISDIDVDDGTNEDTNAIYREISAADVEFRYGRLFIDNAYGPETEALEISLRVEFWDGGAFVLNTDDDCTVISNVALAPALSIVPLSYSAPDFAPDALAIGDTTIGQGLGLTNITLFGGQTSRSEDGDGNDENDSDRPFIASAPIPGVDVPIGSVLVEFDLGSGLLPAVLNFLKYDWRGGAGGSLFDEVPEDLLPATPTGDVYNDNPRALIEFGSYSGHDRVINWQEIYLGL
ncbi:MAG: hypothetical protein IIB72_12260 [Proteobacteria bacterium]|nr:hypothetical protein [Pseudomonadota bacterium]